MVKAKNKEKTDFFKTNEKTWGLLHTVIYWLFKGRSPLSWKATLADEKIGRKWQTPITV